MPGFSFAKPKPQNSCKLNLHYIAQVGCIDVARDFLANGARIDKQDAEGRTPLHDASENGHGELVSLFLGQGADATIKDNKGYVARDLAADKSVEQAFEKHDQENNDGERDLHALGDSQGETRDS